jgi:ADP-ribose pyrophosphatase
MVLPIVENSKILLVKARRPVLGKSLWELPAGGVKNGESHFETAKREMAEETGIKIANLDRFHEFQSFVLASNRMPMFPKIYHLNLSMDEYSKKSSFDQEIENIEIYNFESIKELIKSNSFYSSLSLTVIFRYFLINNI